MNMRDDYTLKHFVTHINCSQFAQVSMFCCSVSIYVNQKKTILVEQTKE